MTKQPVWEPILNDNNPKWLVITEHIKAPEKIEEALNDDIPPEYYYEFNIEKPGLWRCNRCGGTMQMEDTKPTFCSHCERQASFEQVTKNINPNLWKLPRWKSIPEEDIDMLNTYLDMVDICKRSIVFPDEILYEIFALWIISTWKVERWGSVGFPIFRGFIDSGKTRALDLIRELGYRAVHACNVTFPAMVRLSHYHNATILVDEVDMNFNPRSDEGLKFLKFTKTSYRKGSHYAMADIDDATEVLSYKNFGFKAFSGESRFDKAILSRSIDFRMEKEYPQVLELRHIQDELDAVQTKLLNYRYKLNQPPELPDECPLKGRIREIYESIIATGMHVGIKVDHIIKYAQDIEKEKEEAFRDTVEWDVLQALRHISTNVTLDDAPEEVSYKDLAELMDWEWNGKTSQKLGYIMSKKLLLKTKRKSKGTVVLLNDNKNQRRLDYLYKRYKI